VESNSLTVLYNNLLPYITFLDHTSMPPLQLFDLPNELLDHIAQYLDYPSTLAISWTCRSLFSRIKPKLLGYPRPQHWKWYQLGMPDLLKIECWPCFTVSSPDNDSLSVYSSKLPPRNLYACGDCRRLCPVSSFSFAMIKGTRAKSKPSEPYKDSRRFCIPCGVKSGTYNKGTRLRFLPEDDTLMPLANGKTKKEPVAQEDTDTCSDKSYDPERTQSARRKRYESSPAFSLSCDTDSSFGTAIVCQRCGLLKVVKNYSRECIRRRCTECLVYRPPGTRYGSTS